MAPHFTDNTSNWLVLAAFISTLLVPTLGQSVAAQAYTPQPVTCPPTSLVRSAGAGAQSLGSEEAAYVSTRKSTVLPGAWSAYLSNVEAYVAANLNNVTVPDYVKDLLGGDQVPDGLTIGMAVSGGGYRAAFVGGGIMNALDTRNTKSVQAGTGGLLQGLSYLSGLSGGGWLVSSLTQNGFPPFPDLVSGKGSDNSAGETSTYGGFLYQYGFMKATNNIINEPRYINNVVQEGNAKKTVGLPATMTDVWARVLARHFVPGTSSANFFEFTSKHGAGVLWSDAANSTSFTNHTQPFPILIADSVSPNGNAADNMPDGFGVPASNPIYEFNPYEFGSYDPMLSSFIPMQYLGSNSSKCFKGFDQTAYVQAVSSNVFNGATTDAFDVLIKPMQALNPNAGTGILAAQIPNPFKGVNGNAYIDSGADILALADGGTDGQQVPVQPLLVKSRGIDVIIAIDSATDGANGYPAGGSMIDAAHRASLFPNAYSFPDVPESTADFQAQGLASRPTFFGCDTSAKPDAPLVLYFPNTVSVSATSPATNQSTWKFQYADDEVQAMLAQTWDIATQGIPTGGQKDPEWPVCLACAIVDRARAKSGNTPRSGACDACMNRYCWDPSSLSASSNSSSSSLISSSLSPSSMSPSSASSSSSASATSTLSSPTPSTSTATLPESS